MSVYNNSGSRVHTLYTTDEDDKQLAQKQLAQNSKEIQQLRENNERLHERVDKCAAVTGGVASASVAFVATTATKCNPGVIAATTVGAGAAGAAAGYAISKGVK